MALELHMHPLSSYCWKVLIALYELGAPFEPVTVNLGDPEARAAFRSLSPFCKIPALRDTGRGAEVFETSIIIEYLDQNYPGPARLIPDEAEQALEVRLWDRVFDLNLHNVFQQIIGDRLRGGALAGPIPHARPVDRAEEGEAQQAAIDVRGKRQRLDQPAEALLVGSAPAVEAALQALALHVK